MRSFALALTLALVGLAAPTQAQVSFSPVVGYDIDAGGPSVGLAFELGTTLPNLPLQPSIRPMVEYIFADDGGFGFGTDLTYIRANGDLIGRFEPSPGASFLPYAKAGVTLEYLSYGSGFDDTDISLNVGGGAEFTRFFLEGELGLGGYSDLRIRAGYRF